LVAEHGFEDVLSILVVLLQTPTNEIWDVYLRVTVRSVSHV